MGFGFKRITLDLIISRDPTTVKQPKNTRSKANNSPKPTLDGNIIQKIAAQ